MGDIGCCYSRDRSSKPSNAFAERVFSSATPENITAETVTWEIERPSEMLGIHQVAENIYTNREASLNLTVYVYGYNEEDGLYGSDDTLAVSISVAAKVESGFVKNVNITFYNDTQPSQVEWVNCARAFQFSSFYAS